MLIKYNEETWDRVKYIKEYIEYANKEFDEFAKKLGMTKQQKKKYYKKYAKDYIIKSANELADTIEAGFKMGMKNIMGMR